jgi:hypothetical protein
MVLYVKTNIHIWYLVQFFFELELYETKIVKKIETYILFSVAYFRKSCLLWNIVEKYRTAGQATDDNMAHAYGILDT